MIPGRILLIALIVSICSASYGDVEKTVTVVGPSTWSKVEVADAAASNVMELYVRGDLNIRDAAKIEELKRAVRLYTKGYRIRSKKETEGQVSYRVTVRLDSRKIDKAFGRTILPPPLSRVGLVLTVNGTASQEIDFPTIKNNISAMTARAGIEPIWLGQIQLSGGEIEEAGVRQALRSANLRQALWLAVDASQTSPLRGVDFHGAMANVKVTRIGLRPSEKGEYFSTAGGYGETIGMASTRASLGAVEKVSARLWPKRLTSGTLATSGDIVIMSMPSWSSFMLMRRALAKQVSIAFKGASAGQLVLAPSSAVTRSMLLRVWSKYSPSIEERAGILYVSLGN